MKNYNNISSKISNLLMKSLLLLALVMARNQTVWAADAPDRYEWEVDVENDMQSSPNEKFLMK